MIEAWCGDRPVGVLDERNPLMSVSVSDSETIGDEFIKTWTCPLCGYRMIAPTEGDRRTKIRHWPAGPPWP
jgi:hypothetical protein